jgi:SAM-dependent methyltransferase
MGDLRSLPVASEQLGGVLAFYSFIHARRHELPAVLREVRRVLRPGGRVLFAVHEGEGEAVREQFLDEPVPFVATLFSLEELVATCRDAGLAITTTERRAPHPAESTVRIFVEAEKPSQ